MTGGQGSIILTPGSMANVPILNFSAEYNVDTFYVQAANYTVFQLYNTHVTDYCNTDVWVYISGFPQTTMPYAVVDQSPFVDPQFDQCPLKAYVLASATHVLDGGGCDYQLLLFGSVAGQGTVTIDKVMETAQGTQVQFHVSQVQAQGIPYSDSECENLPLSSMYDSCSPTCTCTGQGTIQIEVQGGEGECIDTL
jgi:hypothetical protein